jgi:GGDEF domain-containing protein
MANVFGLLDPRTGAPQQQRRNLFSLVEEDEARRDEMLGQVFGALRENPEERAAMKELARRTRAPMDQVEKAFPEFKAAAEKMAFDPRRFRREYPDLARLALEQPEAGEVALRDPGLPLLVRAVRAAFTGWTPPPSLGEQGMQAWKEGGAEALDAMIAGERDAAAQKEEVDSKPVPMIVDPSEDFSWWEKLVGRRAGEPEKPTETSIAGHYWDAAKGGPPAQVDPRQGARSGPLLPGIVTEPREPGVLERAFRQGQLGLQRAELGREWAARVLRGEDTWDVEKRAVDLERQMVPRFYGDDVWSRTLAATGQFLPQQIDMYAKAAPAAAVAYGGTRAVLARTKLPPAAKAKVAGKVAKWTGVGAGWLSAFNAEFGNTVLDYGDLRTDAGEALSNEARIGWGVVAAGASATVEIVTEVGPVLGQLGPVGEIIRRGELKAFGEALLKKDPRFRAILTDVAKAWGKGAASEGGEEFVQNIIKDAVGYLGKVVEAGGTLQKADVVGSLEQAAGAAEEGALGSLLPGTGRAGVNLASQVAARQSARAGGEALGALMDQAKGPTARFAPELYAAHARAVTERYGEKVDAFYFDTPEILRLFQGDEMTSAGIISEEVERASRELMGETGPERLKAALATGSKLEVPIEEFAERWAPLPIADALKEHVSGKPWVPTLAQEVKDSERREEEAKALVAAIEKDEAPPTPEEAALDRLAEDLAAGGKMKPGAIRDQVKLWRKHLNAMAVRAEVPIAELVQQFEVRVRNAQDVAVEVAPASQALSERYRAMPREERLRTLYVDRNTGLLNRRAFEALPPDPARPLVAHLSIEGTKWANDSGDHNVGNRLYRMAARALHAVAPDAAKVGGDFVVRVKDEAELDALLARAQGALAVPGFTFTGVAGEALPAAQAAHGALKARLEGEGKRAARGARPAGVPEAVASARDLAFPEARVEGVAIPDDLAAAFGRMSDEQAFAAAFTDPATGLLSADGFFALAPKAHVIAIDLKGLRALNDEFGTAFGDEILRQFGLTMVLAGGGDFDAAHLHGDEYALQGDDLATLERYLDILAAMSDNVGVEFRYGQGPDYAEADQDLSRSKRQRPRREEGGAAQAGDRREDDLRGGRGAQPRGVRRQGWAGAPQGGGPRVAAAPLAWAAVRESAQATLAALTETHGETARNLPEWWRAKEQVDRAAAELGRLEQGPFGPRDTSSEAFRGWFRDSKVVDAQGKPLRVYHGAKRPDRIGTRFRKSRATSGPMAYFTDDPEIASKYATGKSDTSLEAPSDYAGWFKLKVGRSMVDIDRAWWHLPPEKRQELAEKLPHVTWDNEDGKDEIRLGGPDEWGLAGGDHWDFTIRREARGNVLRAAVEVWLNSAGLFDQEERFVEVLRAAGLDGVVFDSPWTEFPSVFPVYLSIQNPLDTTAIPPEVLAALEEAGKRRRKPKHGGNDAWDKRGLDPKEWLDRLREDAKEGTTHAWTSIPDWATDALKALGYDGIRDRGGKYHPDQHTVWIPFEETQVKGVFNQGTWNPESANILEQPARPALEAVGADGLPAWATYKREEQGRTTAALETPKGRILLSYGQEEGGPWVNAMRADTGLTVGVAEFVDRGAALKGWQVDVSEDHRRLGIATAMYAWAEKMSGKRVVAGDFQTDEGAAFLSGRGGLRQGSDGGRRGWMSAVRKGAKHLFSIVLDRGADQSTFLHESGHVFMDIFAELAERPTATAQLRADWQAALAFVGAKDRADLDDRRARAAKIRAAAAGRELAAAERKEIADLVAPFEKWARAFERYLMEGQAPSLDLAGAFERFKLWLIGIYKAAAALNVPLSNDIRAVFDRLLATDEEIARARARVAPQSLFRSPEDAGMTPEAWLKHLKDQERATSRAATAARQRALAERLRVADSWWEKERRSRVEEALEEYDALPAAVALRFLRTGDPGENTALAAQLDAARERKAESDKGKTPLPHELQRRLDDIDQEIAAVEVERRVAHQAEKIIVAGGDPTAAREQARARVRESGDVLVGRSDLYRVGGEVLPTWLSLDEYERDSAAWSWTWAALDVWGKDLDTSGRRSQKIDVIERSGKTAPEAAQRAVVGYFRRAFESFPETDTKLLHQGYLLAQLLSAARGDFMRGLRDQVGEWLKTSPAERRYDDPLSPRQWGFVGRKYGRKFQRWHAETKRGVDREALEKDVGAAPPGDAALAAQLAELREQRRKVEAEGEKARIAATRARAKLDYAGAIEVLDPNEVKTKLRGLTATENGISPDDLAEMVAAEQSGAELLRGMVSLQPRREWAEARADERMRADYPDVLSEREELRKIAEEEFHGDAMLAWLLNEWEVLRKRASPDGTAGVPADAIRRAAVLYVERMTLQRLDAGRFERAERAAAEKAFRAAAKRDYAQAYVFWQQRILNHLIYRELLEARKDRDRLQDQSGYLAKPQTRAKIGKASQALRSGVEQILEALGLGGPFEHDRPPSSIGEVVEAIDATGTTVLFDEGAVAELLASPPAAPVANGRVGERWQALTVAQARMVLAALANLRAAGSAQLTILIEGKRLEWSEMKALLVEEAERNLKDRGPPESSVDAGSLLGVAGGLVSGLDGELLRMESLVSEFLGADAGIDSWWFKAVVQPLQEAKHREADLLKAAVAPVIAAMEKIPPAVKKRMRERIDGAALFPGHTDVLQPPTRRYELIALALNAGNESNLERLLIGRGITMDELMRALGMLTREELDYVQTVWDAAESLWPLARALEERLSGMAPPKIDPRPLTVTLQDGTEAHLRGGYFPAVYDRRVDVKGEIQADEVRKGVDFLDPGFVRPGTAHSHLKGRVTGARGIISLDPTIIQAHLVQVAHDIAFREAVLSVGSIFLDKDIQGLLRRRLGEKKALLFLDWVKDAGRARAAEAVSQARTWNRVNRALRSNMAVGVLGYAADIVAGDLTNIPVASTQFKDPRHLAAGVAEAVRDPAGARERALKLSGELRFRADETLNAWRLKRNELTKRRFPGREALDVYVDHAFDFFETMDALTATPIWLGAFREGLALYANDQAKAVTYADALVRKVFPSHSVVDMSALQRDRGFWGSVMLFFGYLNTVWGRRRAMFHEAAIALRADDATAKSRAAAVARLGWRMLALVAAYQILGEWLSGRGPEDGERFTEWLLRKALMGLTVNDLPFGALAEPIATKLVGGEFRRVSARAAPAVAVAEEAGRSIMGAFEGDEGAGEAFFDLARSLGLAFGVPTRPLRAADYLVDWLEGETAPRGPGDVAAGLVYGERAAQPGNPLQDAQDLVSEGLTP